MNGKETSVEENENWREREWSYLCRNNMPIWKTDRFLNIWPLGRNKILLIWLPGKDKFMKIWPLRINKISKIWTLGKNGFKKISIGRRWILENMTIWKQIIKKN